MAVHIPDSLYRLFKKQAADERNSIRGLLRGVQLGLRSHLKGRQRHPPVIESDQPGSLELDNAKIYDAILFP
jgi:hypothetical protein